MFNTKRFFASLVTNKHTRNLRSAIAIGSLFPAFFILQDRKDETQHLKSENRSNLLPQNTLWDMFISLSHITDCASGVGFKSNLTTRGTVQLMENSSTKKSLRSVYNVKWKKPLGEGGFGTVYLGKHRKTGELVAVKKISKRFTCDSSVKGEMDAFLHIRQAGDHPNICGLHENFEEGDYYYLVLDLVQGGEMFDHLIKDGAYSEADAARLVREVGSALNFLHGIGLVHSDLKPENLMLSSENCSDAVIKVVDFGCADIIDENSPLYNPDGNESQAITPGYSPAEMIDKKRRANNLQPSVDMFSLGVIIYIMLTGVHPFDVSGEATDEELNQQILSGKMPPLRNSPITSHLSPSAIDLIENLMKFDPDSRMTALEMLNHPWTRGETAKTGKITDSDKKLKGFRKYKSALQAKFFASMVQASDSLGDYDDETKKASLIQRSFQMIDSEKRGYITAGDLNKLYPKATQNNIDEEQDQDSHLSLSGFSDLLLEDMKSIFLPADHVIFREGDIGDKIYFINSGRVEVSTKGGFSDTTDQGGFFGEGALLSKLGRRNATIKCITPIHAIEISKEYFDKYLADGASTKVSVLDKDRLRKRERATAVLSVQDHLEEDTIKKGDYVYDQGEEGKDIFLLEAGAVELHVDGHPVYSVKAAELFGEYAAIFGRPRNSTAICRTDTCTIQIIEPKVFDSIMKANPDVQEGLKDVLLRREFKKALVYNTKKPIPVNECQLREAFKIIDDDGSGEIDLIEVGVFLRKMDKTFTDDDVAQILLSLDIDECGTIDWDEFKRIFGV